MGKLAERFADVEAQWGEWIIEEEADRVALRLKKSPEELKAFYDATLPRVKEYVEYLDQFDLDNLPEDATNLWWLLSSFAGAAGAIELYGGMGKIPGVELNVRFRSVGMPNETALLR